MSAARKWVVLASDGVDHFGGPVGYPFGPSDRSNTDWSMCFLRFVAKPTTTYKNRQYAKMNSGLILQIDGIEGDCRHPRYGGWMNVLWFSFGGAGEFGQNRPTHVASMKMLVGRISTTLQVACLRGDRFRSASLVALHPSGVTERFHGAMEDVRITGFQYEGYALDRAIHSLELTYHVMESREPREAPERNSLVVEKTPLQTRRSRPRTRRRSPDTRRPHSG